MNWENAPEILHIDLDGTISWNGLDRDSASKIIQRAYLRHYTRRKVAARKINNWVWNIQYIQHLSFCNALGVHKFDRNRAQRIYASKIQRAYLRHYTRRKVAARKITNGCSNWVWKPECKDLTMGIRLRLDLQYLRQFVIPPDRYSAAKIIQRAYLRHYTRRKVAARKITNRCHDWVWKPKCKDGTTGIRPRIDTQYLYGL